MKFVIGLGCAQLKAHFLACWRHANLVKLKGKNSKAKYESAMNNIFM